MITLSQSPRPRVRWSTHWQHILLLLAVMVGGSLFGVSFTLFPLRPSEPYIGVAILLGVGAALVWTVLYLLRPVQPEQSRRSSRK